MHTYVYMADTEMRLIIFFAAKDGEAVYSQQKQKPGADWGSDHDHLIAKVRLKLKKVAKTTLSIRSSPLNLYLTSTV